MHRFFVSPEDFPNVTGSDAHQIRSVLRLKPKATIELLDGTSKVSQAKISKITKDKVYCEIISTSVATTEPSIKITLAQALPKSKKMDLIIQKCTELGINKIIPLLSERSITKSAKLERWQKIAKEAAEQSGRAIIPQITPSMTFAELIKLTKEYDLALIPWELEKEQSLKNILTKNEAKNLLFIIGPEGGFSQKEIASAKEAGITPVSLGKRILRTETAGMAIMAMLLYEKEL